MVGSIWGVRQAAGHGTFIDKILARQGRHSKSIHEGRWRAKKISAPRCADQKQRLVPTLQHLTRNWLNALQRLYLLVQRLSWTVQRLFPELQRLYR